MPSRNQDSDGYNDNQWHLDKKVPLGLIFAMIAQAAMVLWTIADIKKDVEVLKSVQVIQLDRDSRQDRTAGEAVGLVREDIKEVKGMLARLLDKEMRPTK